MVAVVDEDSNRIFNCKYLFFFSFYQIEIFQYGSSPSLRAASSLGDQHPHLARDLFPAAFMSVWTELDSDVQNDLTSCLLRAISTGIPELIQTILNLAEFMDHSEKGPLPISHDVLGRWAEQTKAFAKACRYKEMSVLKKSGSMQTTFTRKVKLEPNDCQSLITLVLLKKLKLALYFSKNCIIFFNGGISIKRAKFLLKMFFLKFGVISDFSKN